MNTDKMHQSTVEAIVQMAMMVPPEFPVKVLDTFARADAIGPIVDPTTYRREMDNLQMSSHVWEAFAVFHAELRRLQAKGKP